MEIIFSISDLYCSVFNKSAALRNVFLVKAFLFVALYGKKGNDDLCCKYLTLHLCVCLVCVC